MELDRFFLQHDQQVSFVRKAFGYFTLTWLAVIVINLLILLATIAGVIFTSVYCLKLCGVL